MCGLGALHLVTALTNPVSPLMHLGTYFCEGCPLAFEMATGPLNDFNPSAPRRGWIKGLVCSLCGTMNNLEFYRKSIYSSDRRTGTSELFALPKALRSLLELENRRLRLNEAGERGESATDWIKVGEFPYRVDDLSLLSCGQCKAQASLIDQDSLRTGGFRCPVCQGPIQSPYAVMCH